MSLFSDAEAIYHMNDGWTDASGNGNDLTPTGATINNVDQLLGAGCGELDGIDDFARKINPSIGSNNTGAISGWVKATAFSGDAMASYAESTTNNSDECTFTFTLNGTPRLFFRVGGVVDRLDGGAIDLTDDEWHNIIFQSDGSEVEIWVDGVQHTVTETTGTNRGQWFADATDADNFMLGAIGRLTIAGYFAAKEDEVVILNRPFTPAEITWLWNGGAGREVLPGNINRKLGRGLARGLGRGI